MKESIDLFASEKPMYYARGNHETRGEFATSFQKYFSPKEPFLYYLFRQGPVCFIMLDTGEDKPDSDIEYSGITDYDGYRTDQVEWIYIKMKISSRLNLKLSLHICLLLLTSISGMDRKTS